MHKPHRRGSVARTVLLAGVTAIPLTAAMAGENVTALRELSLEELGDIQISSVSKKAEPLSEAPAAIYVLTGEEILRSGASSVAEMLRLAPNLQVAQAASNVYAISARGFNNPIANKLLVLIDGRSVYTPLYGGVYWDMQDVMREDIDRIEVISGPGATLWGANAVNGVINITTRKAFDTAGGVFDAAGGNLERSAGARYGHVVNDNVAYRFYAKGFVREAVQTPAGASNQDHWSMAQGGFRVDWNASTNDALTLQGDIYRGSVEQRTPIDQAVGGENALIRWQHEFGGGSNLQVQAYYDRTHRLDAGGFVLNIYDFDAQHGFTMGGHDIVWGGGYRLIEDSITNVDAFQIQPPRRSLDLANVFVQDSVALGASLKLTVGVKLEDDPYVDVTALPSARLAWQVTDNAMLWSAVSRAVRAPTRFDRDVLQKLGTIPFLIGGPDFRSEKVMAYEIGARLQPSPDLSFSVSGFYNVYDDLRSIEPNPAGGLLPLRFGNFMAGSAIGVEAWANYQAADWWRLSAGLSVQDESLHFDAGGSGLGGLQTAGNDADVQASLRSSMTLAQHWGLEVDLRYRSALPNPRVPAFVEAGARLSWQASELLEISLTGANLLHTYHRDFTNDSYRNLVERSFVVETRWRF